MHPCLPGEGREVASANGGYPPPLKQSGKDGVQRRSAQAKRPVALEDHQFIYLCLTISCGEPIRIEELLASPTFHKPRLMAAPSPTRLSRPPPSYFLCRWLRASHSEGDIPTRCVKTRVRAVAFAYPTADAISFSELPLRNMVWATPSRQFLR